MTDNHQRPAGIQVAPAAGTIHVLRSNGSWEHKKSATVGACNGPSPTNDAEIRTLAVSLPMEGDINVQ